MKTKDIHDIRDTQSLVQGYVHLREAAEILDGVTTDEITADIEDLMNELMDNHFGEAEKAALKEWDESPDREEEDEDD